MLDVVVLSWRVITRGAYEAVFSGLGTCFIRDSILAISVNSTHGA